MPRYTISLHLYTTEPSRKIKIKNERAGRGKKSQEMDSELSNQKSIESTGVFSVVGGKSENLGFFSSRQVGRG